MNLWQGLHIYSTEKWAKLNIKEEEEEEDDNNEEQEVIEDTLEKKTKKRRGKYFDPKSSKNPRWEEDKDRYDGNNRGGMGAGQQAGLAIA